MTETITIRLPNDLAPGETAYIDFTTSQPPTPEGLPDLPKAGWLVKRGPYDGVVFDSYFSERLRGQADGMSSGIPADSARTLDSNDVGAYVQVTNPSTNSNTLAAEDLEIILFGHEQSGQAEQGSNRLQFSGAAVIGDIVPGVRTTDGR